MAEARYRTIRPTLQRNAPPEISSPAIEPLRQAENNTSTAVPNQNRRLRLPKNAPPKVRQLPRRDSSPRSARRSWFGRALQRTSPCLTVRVKLGLGETKSRVYSLNAIFVSGRERRKPKRVFAAAYAGCAILAFMASRVRSNPGVASTAPFWLRIAILCGIFAVLRFFGDWRSTRSSRVFRFRRPYRLETTGSLFNAWSDDRFRGGGRRAAAFPVAFASWLGEGAAIAIILIALFAVGHSLSLYTFNYSLETKVGPLTIRPDHRDDLPPLPGVLRDLVHLGRAQEHRCREFQLILLQPARRPAPARRGRNRPPSAAAGRRRRCPWLRPVAADREVEDHVERRVERPRALAARLVVADAQDAAAIDADGDRVRPPVELVDVEGAAARRAPVSARSAGSSMHVVEQRCGATRRSGSARRRPAP